MTLNDRERLVQLLLSADEAIAQELLRADFSPAQACTNMIANAAIIFALTHNRSIPLEQSLTTVLNTFRSIYEMINEASIPLPETTILGQLQHMRAETEANAKH